MRRTMTAVVAAGVLLLGGCSGGSDDDGDPEATTTPIPTESSELAPIPSESAQTEPGEVNQDGIRLEVTITADGVQPQGERVDVAIGQPVTLVVTSDVADEVHVHSDPEVTLDVAPGETVEETFTLERPGQVAVESHGSGATIAQLVVQR